MRTLVKNIKSLLQVETTPREKVCGADMAQIEHIENAYLIVDDGHFAAFGPMAELKEQTFDKEVDATGRMALPSFCDSHTHLVYAGSREIEYIDKIRGLSYDQIAKRGGGILNSAKRVQEASEEQLYDDAMARLETIIRYGTGAVEIKSGYGMTP
ncbi:MAG: imidazolonepropionase, partial [Bacteroidales bacterium]|nr:imidazolonepropionase [Bacteroidales bacterium]